MNEFRFLEWQVYKDAQGAVIKIFQLTRNFPQQFRYDLGSQINRSAISMVLNIAEGSGKQSDNELNRFLNIALGSINEVVAGLDLACKNELIKKLEFNETVEKLQSITRQIGGFKKKLK